MNKRFIFFIFSLIFCLCSFAQGNTKCKVGEVASDFTFLDHNANELYMSDVNAQYIVLFFYNPDCEHCQKYLNQLKKNKLLANYIHKSKIALLAIAVECSEEMFGEHFFELPIDWFKGYCEDCEEIVEHYLQKVPAIFVIDDIKMVIKSDITPNDLEAFIKTILLED